MKISKNEKVQKFLEDLNNIESDKFEIVREIRNLIIQIIPNPSERLMYGGIIFFSDTEMVSGLFVNKNHITIEFSRGYLMNDPHNQLEGKGKYRRHLKLKTKEDIDIKNASYFIDQIIDK